MFVSVEGPFVISELSVESPKIVFQVHCFWDSLQKYRVLGEKSFMANLEYISEHFKKISNIFENDCSPACPEIGYTQTYKR